MLTILFLCFKLNYCINGEVVSYEGDRLICLIYYRTVNKLPFVISFIIVTNYEFFFSMTGNLKGYVIIAGTILVCDIISEKYCTFNRCIICANKLDEFAYIILCCLGIYIKVTCLSTLDGYTVFIIGIAICGYYRPSIIIVLIEYVLTYESVVIRIIVECNSEACYVIALISSAVSAGINSDTKNIGIDTVDYEIKYDVASGVFYNILVSVLPLTVNNNPLSGKMADINGKLVNLNGNGVCSVGYTRFKYNTFKRCISNESYYTVVIAVIGVAGNSNALIISIITGIFLTVLVPLVLKNSSCSS